MRMFAFIVILAVVCNGILVGSMLGLSSQQPEHPRCKDYDQDQLCLKEELDLGTDPYQADTDRDGLSDGEEVNRGTNPLNADTDGDKVKDSKDLFPRINNNYIYQVCGVLIVTILGIGFLFATPRGLQSLESLMSKVTITSRKQEKKEAGLSISESKDMELRKCKDCAYLRGFRKEKKDGYTIISPKCNNYCGERKSVIDLDISQQEEV